MNESARRNAEPLQNAALTLYISFPTAIIRNRDPLRNIKLRASSRVKMDDGLFVIRSERRLYAWDVTSLIALCQQDNGQSQLQDCLCRGGIDIYRIGVIY